MSSFIVPKNQNEIVWARAHAYFAKNFHSPIINNKAMVESNDYIIVMGDFAVSRELVEEGVLIRISSTSIQVEESKGEYRITGQGAPYTKKHVIEELMEYMKTGQSPSMKDYVIPIKAKDKTSSKQWIP